MKSTQLKNTTPEMRNSQGRAQQQNRDDRGKDNEIKAKSIEMIQSEQRLFLGHRWKK